MYAIVCVWMPSGIMYLYCFALVLFRLHMCKCVQMVCICLSFFLYLVCACACLCAFSQIRSAIFINPFITLRLFILAEQLCHTFHYFHGIIPNTVRLSTNPYFFISSSASNSMQLLFCFPSFATLRNANSFPFNSNAIAITNKNVLLEFINKNSMNWIESVNRPSQPYNKSHMSCTKSSERKKKTKTSLHTQWYVMLKMLTTNKGIWTNGLAKAFSISI